MSAIPWPAALGLVLSSAGCVPLLAVVAIAWRDRSRRVAALRLPITLLAVFFVSSLALRAAYYLPVVIG